MRGMPASTGTSATSLAEPPFSTAFTTESGVHGAGRVRRRPPWACASVANAARAERTERRTVRPGRRGRNMAKERSTAPAPSMARRNATLPRMTERFGPLGAEPGTRPPWRLAMACGLAAFLFYAWTTSPYVLNEDIAEFQALSATHGISHAGYPLYLLALELFHRLPFSTVAYRANLVSGFAAAIAVA